MDIEKDIEKSNFKSIKIKGTKNRQTLLSVSILLSKQREGYLKTQEKIRENQKGKKERNKGGKRRRKENEQTRNKLNLKRADNSSAKFSEQRCKE